TPYAAKARARVKGDPRALGPWAGLGRDLRERSAPAADDWARRTPPGRIGAGQEGFTVSRSGMRETGRPAGRPAGSRRSCRLRARCRRLVRRRAGRAVAVWWG